MMQKQTPKRAFGMVLQAIVLLGSANIAMAQEMADIPLDLLDIPDVVDDGDWADVAAAKPFTWELTTGIRREMMSGPLAAVAVNTPAIGFASIALDVDTTLTPSLSFRGRGVLHSEGDTTAFFVQRGVLEYAPKTVPVRLSFGKQYTAWSFSDLAHVLDPSPREAARIDTSDSFDDYANPFVMAQAFGDRFELSFLAMSEGSKLNRIKADPHLYALHFETQISQANLAAQVIKRDGGDSELGLSVNAAVGSAILSFEGTVGSRRRLPVAFALPNGGAFGAANTKNTTYQAVLAARVPVSKAWQLEATYLYNGHGYSDAEWSGFLAAEQSVLTAMSNGNYTYAGFLGTARNAHADQYLRRNYLAFTLSTLEEIGTWSVSLGAVQGLDDNGTFGFVNASRPIGENGQLSLSLTDGFGRQGSEFARRPAEASLKMVWKF